MCSTSNKSGLQPVSRPVELTSFSVSFNIILDLNDWEIKLMSWLNLMIRTYFKSLWANVKCIYDELNNLKDYSFTLLAKDVKMLKSSYPDTLRPLTHLTVSLKWILISLGTKKNKNLIRKSEFTKWCQLTWEWGF